MSGTGIEYESDLISVVVLTFRRPRLLSRCLESLRALEVPPGRRLEIVVVEDSAGEEGAPVAERWSSDAGHRLRYVVQAGANISRARNRGLEEARGELVAFLDDDEWASPGWLVAMVSALVAHDADAVFGPSVAEFEGGSPPPFAPDTSFYDRDPDLPTGARREYGSTANVLLQRSLLPGGAAWFDPALGRTGGEDFELFLRRGRGGARYVWCREAEVHNFVPRARQTRRFMVRRSFREGQTNTMVRARLSTRPAREALRWMAKGAAQAAVFGPLALAALVGVPLHGTHHLHRFAAGLGKLLWGRCFRSELYATAGYGPDRAEA